MQGNNISNNERRPELSQPSQNAQNLRSCKIIILIEIVLIVVLAIANIAVMLSHPTPNNPTPNNPTQVSDISACKHMTKEEIYDLLENVTKDEAISIIKNMHGEAKCTSERLLPEKLKLKPNEFAHEILYSYDDAAEVPSIAQDSVMGQQNELFNRKSTDDFLIDETTDYYTIVSVDNSKIPCGELDEYQSSISCYRGISFNRKYLDHHEKVEDTVHSDEMIFNGLSSDFVELALKIIIATDIWNNKSLYDYYFEDNGDNFTLTGIYFGVGLDMNNLEGASASNVPYAINIYEKKLKLDKNTRKVAWEKFDSYYGEKSSSNNLKSFSLSENEVAEIQALIYETGNDEQPN